MSMLYRAHGRVWLGDSIGHATEVAHPPSENDPRWTNGLPASPEGFLALDILMLGPLYPSGRQDVSIGRKGDSTRDDVNHPLLHGCRAWMPLFLLEGDWKHIYRGMVLPGAWEDIGDHRYVKHYNDGACRIEAHLYDGKVLLTGHLHGNWNGVMRASVQVGEFRIPYLAEQDLADAITALEQSLATASASFIN